MSGETFSDQATERPDNRLVRHCQLILDDHVHRRMKSSRALGQSNPRIAMMFFHQQDSFTLIERKPISGTRGNLGIVLLHRQMGYL